ncbi:MAG TPA: hypothetical protein VNI54_00725 [Thermoanaerobaculia bacterium]|nr:hypothetical protein [Thermoanaerobaculia bacterium]
MLLLAVPAAAQEVATAVVPVVGSVFGATMVRWKTDVEIVNDTGSDVDFAMELPLSAELAEMATRLPRGASLRYPDVTGQLFGIDHVLSPLVVRTFGRRSVTVRANVYAVHGAGPPSALQPLTTMYGSSFYPVRVLDGLAFSDDFRTNIGLVNFGERDADFVLALQRIPGRTIAVSPVRVRAGSLIHTTIQSLFPLISKGSGFLVVVETPFPDTYVYGSVIESATQSGTFVAPRIR